MEIRERKLISRAKLEGRKLHVLEDVLIDTGVAFKAKSETSMSGNLSRNECSNFDFLW